MARDQNQSEGRVFDGFARLRRLLVPFVLLVALVGASFAVADEPPSAGEAAIPPHLEAPAGSTTRVEPTLTDPGVAEELPHEDLGREESGELLERVFEPEMQGPAGIYADLHVEKFLAPDVAVIAAGEQPEISSEEGRAGSLSGQAVQGATLMDSTMPLAVEGSSGNLEALDLNLERTEGDLAPANSLLEVTIPAELGEGIELPGPGIDIEPERVVESRAASKLDGTVAFYPNVSEEADLAIAPTLGGVETLTQLRSPQSPRSEIYKIRMPAGASLTKQGAGAVVMRGEETLMTVSPPAALDADGVSVPTDLSVAGNEVMIEVSPASSTKYPVLVDPLFQSFEWYARHESESLYGGWEGWTTTHRVGQLSGGTITYSNGTSYPMQSFVPVGSRGPDLSALNAQASPGAEFLWEYHVPRYGSDPQERAGAEPEIFISRMTTSDVAWRAEGETNNPYMLMGLWGPSAGWASLAMHEGLMGHSINNLGYVYNFPNELSVLDVQTGALGLYFDQTVSHDNAELFVGAATIELSEPANVNPQFFKLTGPKGWLTSAPTSVVFGAKDPGLGVRTVSAKSEAPGSPTTPWTTIGACTGVAKNPCPFRSEGTVIVEPAKLPTGIDVLNVVAEDPIGHASPVEHVELAVDHSAPEVSLTGTATEQATLGTKRGSYSVKVNAVDGSTAHPQSGVAKVFIEFDGTVVKKEEPGCETENCAVPLEWTIESEDFPAGEHTLRAWAVDAVGNSSVPIERKITLTPSPPALSLSGSMTEQSTLGVSRPRYRLRVNAGAEAGIATTAPAPTFSGSFGGVGTGNGQFSHPADLARDASGDIWVVDQGNDRVQEFGPQGEYISQFGSLGTGQGQFKEPSAIAIGPDGKIWVADTGNKRIEEFNAQGQFVSTFGSAGSGNGQFIQPSGVAVAPGGDVWVADGHGMRLEEFTPAGVFMISFSKAGTKHFLDPTGIDISPDGDLYVSDQEDTRVFEFTENGNFIREFGGGGSGNGQFNLSGALTLDAAGDVWVGDKANGRFEEFDPEGHYLAQFGSKGSGEGQMTLTAPSGVAVAPGGRIWITDTGNNRIERWTATRPAPTYSGSFGTAGAGDAQFSHPADLARDVAGDLWVLDKGNDRVEEFGPNGGYISQFGSLGSGQGQFKEPAAIAIGGDGKIWVADTGNHRVEEFDPQGQFVSTFGSSGGGNGQFIQPSGIAVAPDGDIWVADGHGLRIEEFTPTGGFIRSVTKAGTKAFSDPTGIAVSSEGDVWVADWERNRVDELSETGTFIREVGATGTGNGQFRLSGALTLDAAGDVWVGDQTSGRFEEFDPEGRYLAQFGSPGPAEGQMTLSWPSGVAVGPSGRIWTTDTGNNRIEEWIPADPGAEIVAEIRLDGKPVDYEGKSCGGEHCSITDEWTLESAAATPGKHEVAVSVSDGLGNKVTKKLPIEVQPDTTLPSLEVSGELASAPEGWVQQETYGLHATATDAGYGVTSLLFKVDGQTVASENASCPDGGCALSLSSQVNMAPYSGGAHEAELVATDGAGNRRVKSWTINVDPEGRITTQEETKTLEAVEDTSEQSPVASTEELIGSEQREGGDNPGLQVSGSEIKSTGVPDVTTMTTNPEDGIALQSPEGTTTITPIGTENSSNTSVAHGVAGVTANVAKEVDSVVRPEYNGVQIAQAIRSEQSRHTFSWRVSLGWRQELVQVSATQAEVIYTDGIEAFLITAEPAHDATGKPVPTTLSVSGGVLTVNVEFQGGGFVFPIVAGQGWETSYKVPVIVQVPEDETQIREREERENKEAEERAAAEGGGGEPPVVVPPSPVPPAYAERLVENNKNAGGGVVPPPQPVCHGTCATGSSVVEVFVVEELRDCQIDHCNEWWISIAHGSNNERPKFERGYDWAEWVNNTPYGCHYYYNTVLAFAGLSISEQGCQLNNVPWKVFKRENKHLTIWGRFHIEQGFGTDLYTGFKENYVALQVHIWPNGYQEPVIRGYSPNVGEF